MTDPGSRNLTPEQKRSTAGFKRFLPLREFMGRARGGPLEGPCVWHDTHSNKTYPAGEEWNVPPPDLPSGDQGRLPSYLPPSERYRQHYATIDWSA